MMIKEAWSTCGQYSGNGQHGQYGGNSQHGQCDQYGGNVQHGQHEFQFLIFYFMKRYMNLQTWSTWYWCRPGAPGQPDAG